jgi:hypothetical protein
MIAGSEYLLSYASPERIDVAAIFEPYEKPRRRGTYPSGFGGCPKFFHLGSILGLAPRRSSRLQINSASSI